MLSILSFILALLVLIVAIVLLILSQISLWDGVLSAVLSLAVLVLTAPGVLVGRTA